MKLTPLVSAMLVAFSGAVSAASYEVQELPISDIANQHFGVSIDNQGLALSSARARFNPPVDMSLFDVDNHPNLTEPEAAAEGNFNATDLFIVADDFTNAATSGNPRLQKLAQIIAYQSDGVEANYVYGFDSESAETNGYSYALNTSVTDSVNASHIIGNMAGPYSVINYTDENAEEQVYVVNDFALRAFVQVGSQVTALEPAYTRAGGFSFASAINDNLQVAGVSSVGAADTLEQVIDDCENDDVRVDIPVEVCKFNVANNNGFAQEFIMNSGFLLSQRNAVFFESAPATFLDNRPTLWQLDADGNIISTQTYELLHTPDPYLPNMYTRVTDINNAGTMVGFTTVPESEREGGLVAIATVFENGQTSRLFEQREDIVASYATAINDNDIVVGFYPEIINSTLRNRMFVFDRNSSELNKVDGLFISSTTYPRAINNNNMIVGDAESDVLDPSTRKVSGFLYDLNEGTFTNLNDLLPCDSPYTIISANDINDANEIIADAQVTRPSRDIKGEVLTGDSAGETGTVVSVILNPTGAEPSNCEEVDDFSERKGASFNLFIALPLVLLTFLRRKKLSR